MHVLLLLYQLVVLPYITVIGQNTVTRHEALIVMLIVLSRAVHNLPVPGPLGVKFQLRSILLPPLGSIAILAVPTCRGPGQGGLSRYTIETFMHTFLWLLLHTTCKVVV